MGCTGVDSLILTVKAILNRETYRNIVQTSFIPNLEADEKLVGRILEQSLVSFQHGEISAEEIVGILVTSFVDLAHFLNLNRGIPVVFANADRLMGVRVAWMLYNNWNLVLDHALQHPGDPRPSFSMSFMPLTPGKRTELVKAFFEANAPEVRH